MANYGISAIKMQSQYNDALLKAGVVTTDGVTEVPNGAFVLADNDAAAAVDIYGAVDFGVDNFKRFATSATGAAYILDAVVVPSVAQGGNVYKVGGVMTDIVIDPADVDGGRYRKLEVEDKFILFDGNISGTVSSANKYLIPTNGSFALTATDSAAVSGFCAVVLGSLPLNNGLTNVGTQYIVKVISI